MQPDSNLLAASLTNPAKQLLGLLKAIKRSQRFKFSNVRLINTLMFRSRSEMRGAIEQTETPEGGGMVVGASPRDSGMFPLCHNKRGRVGSTDRDV